jgi:hypothetical protein
MKKEIPILTGLIILATFFIALTINTYLTKRETINRLETELQEYYNYEVMSKKLVEEMAYFGRESVIITARLEGNYLVYYFDKTVPNKNFPGAPNSVIARIPIDIRKKEK